MPCYPWEVILIPLESLVVRHGSVSYVRRYAVHFVCKFPLLFTYIVSPAQAHPPLLAPRLVLRVLQVWIHLLSEWQQGAVFLVVATGCLCTRGVWVGG